MQIMVKQLVVALASLLLAVPAGAGETVVLVAGGDGPEDGPANRARLDGPFGVDFDRGGEMFIVELTGRRVLKIDQAGRLRRVAGTCKEGNGGDGGPALQADFNGMHSLAVTPNGSILVADTWNNRVRRIDARTGIVTAFAGTGRKGFSGDDGPALHAEFGGIYCVALDPTGRLAVLTDLDNRRIRMVDLASGVVRTVAGNGSKGVPRDGDGAKESPLVDPRAAVQDSQGRLYILERGGNALRVVNAQGRIRTLIGDGKSAVSLKGPKHLCLDRDENVIVADTENHRILKYLPRENGVNQIAGTGEKGSAGIGGPPDKVQLNQPHGVCVNAAGELFIADSSNHRVLKIQRAP